MDSKFKPNLPLSNSIQKNISQKKEKLKFLRVLILDYLYILDYSKKIFIIKKLKILKALNSIRKISLSSQKCCPIAQCT